MSWHHFATCLITLGFVLGPGACSEDPARPAPLLEQALTALGGRERVMAVRNERVVATGTRFEPGGGRSPSQPLLASMFSYSRTTDLEQASTVQTLKLALRFPVAAQLEFDEAWTGHEGSVRGVDNIFARVSEPRSMPITRVTAERRHALLRSPLAMLRHVLDGSLVAVEARDGDGRRLLELSDGRSPPIRLVFNERGLPTRAETMQDYPPLGDVTVGAFYGDFRETGGIKLPFEVSMQVNGLNVHEEQRSDISVNVERATEISAMPEASSSADDAAFGDLASEWFVGLKFLGLTPLFHVQRNLASTIVELGPEVYYVQGTRHHCLAIGTAAGYVVVDAPLYEERVATILSELKRLFPGRSLTHIIATHFHRDHIGGIRHLAAEGDVTVISGAASAAFFREIFSRAHQLRPDRFAAQPQRVDFVAVANSQVLDNPGRRIELHRIKNDHAEDMLVVYLPELKLLFNTDLFSPGQFGPGPLPPVSKLLARQLYDEIGGLGLDVQTVVGGHGAAPATFADLASAVRD